MVSSLTSQVLVGGIIVLVVLCFWVYRINCALSSVPAEALAASPCRWTKQEIHDTFEWLKKQPIDYRRHLPQKQPRRYVVVGGSGMVGGFIVLQLLDRGQSPESIRIIDSRPPNREDMSTGDAARVDFVQTDITSVASAAESFSKPWPAPVARWPLTVFHTAAVIRPSERSKLHYERCRAVNVSGTANVLAAARKAGADIFVATSSASIGIVPIKPWIAPWQRHPGRYAQIYNEDDFDKPMRPHSEFFANYAHTKAEAERLVCSANEEGFRTGCVRPGNGVYGHKDDWVFGKLLQLGSAGSIVSWTPHCIQNLVSARNVSLAHLQFEQALLPANTMPKCAGRPFVVTDPGPAPMFRDFYLAAQETSVTPFQVTLPPPVLMLGLAYMIEHWCILLTVFPFLTRLGLSEPAGPIHMLQPSVFTASAHMICVDAKARRSVKEGGLGYTGVENSLEGICQQIVDWNREVEARGIIRGSKVTGDEGDPVSGRLMKAGFVPEPVAA